MEEIKRELIKKHLEDWTGLKQSSIEHFAKSGKASGSFFMALKDMLDDYDKQLRLHNVSGYRLQEMIDELEKREERIKQLDEDAYDFLTEDLIQDTKVIALLAKIFLHRVDWLLSGDDSSGTFKERIKEDLLDAGFSSYGSNSISFPSKKVYGFTKKLEQ